MENEVSSSEMLACASYYEAIGHLEAAYHIECQIKQSCDDMDHYYNNLGRRNYPFFLRCNVYHYTINAYEQLLRSIIYSEDRGITDRERKEMGIFGHKLHKKICLIPHPSIQKFDREIKQGMRVVKSSMREPETQQERTNQKKNFRKFGSLGKMARFLDKGKKELDIRYQYENLSEGEEISVAGSSDIEMVFTILLVMFDVQSRRLWEKYKTFHDIRGYLPNIDEFIGIIIESRS